MVQFTFSDLLLKAGIDPAKTKLIRHSFSSWHFRECFNRGLVKEYTAEQKQGFSEGYFQFSILQLLEKTATADEVIQTESLWKKKLQTIAFGMNDN